MSDEKFAYLVRAVAEHLSQLPQPVSPRELMQAVRSNDRSVTDTDIRQVLWHMQSTRQLDFTPDWKVQGHAS